MKHDLLRIPGVGKEIKQDLITMGYTCVEDLKGADPEKLYQQHCQIEGCQVDRCQLYVFRCAVYYANNETHDPEKLKWWNWKDEKLK